MKKVMFFIFFSFFSKIYSQQIVSEDEVQKNREQLIQYAIDSKLIPLVSQLQNENSNQFNKTLLSRLETSHNKDLKSAILKLFKETNDQSAKEIAIEFVKEESTSTRINIMAESLDYLTTLSAEDPKVKELLWDIIVNNAEPQKSRLVILALQFFNKIKGYDKGNELLKLYKDDMYPEEPKNTILWLLGEFKEKAALDILQEIIHNETEDPYRKSIAIKALVHIKGESSLDEIVPFMDQENNTIRLAVIESLAEFSNEKSLKLLEEGLRDNNKSVRIRSINAIALRHNEKLTSALVYMLKNDSEEEVKKSSLNALVQIKNSEALQALEEVFISDRFPANFRFIALETLLKYKKESLLEALLKSIEKENLNYPSDFLLNLSAKMSNIKGGNYTSFYKKIIMSSNITLKMLAQKGARFNGVTL